jgi:hypothetical protein
VVAPIRDESVLSAKRHLQWDDVVLLSWLQLLSGIHAFFWYLADIYDPRTGMFNRNMINCGHAGVRYVDASALSIVFAALNAIAFGATLGLLAFVATAALFLDSVRARPRPSTLFATGLAT